jgi:hypothetical protein
MVGRPSKISKYFCISQHSGSTCERVSSFFRICGYQEKTHDIDRLAIDRIELDCLVKASENPKWLAYA